MRTDISRGRLAVLLAAAVLVGALVFLRVATGSFHDAWTALRVPAMTSSFADLRSVTQALDCVQAGINPFATNDCDLWGRPFNYPSIWLRLGSLGVTSASTDVIGCMFFVLFWLALFLMQTSKTTIGALFVFATVMSPPALLGLERGNIDVLIFSILIISLYSISMRPGVSGLLLNCVTISILGILKIYPVAAATQLLHRKWGLPIAALATAIVATGLLSFDGLEGLRLIARHTPQTIDLSYGALPVFLWAKNHHFLGDSLSPDMLRLLAAATGLTVGIIAFGASVLLPSITTRLPALDASTVSGAIAIACTSIFCFSFLLGSNYDYRLIFLIGAVPMIIDRYEASGLWSNFAPIATIVVYLWVSKFSGHFFIPFELLGWLIFAAGCACIGQFMFCFGARRRQHVDAASEPDRRDGSRENGLTMQGLWGRRQS